MIISIKNKVLRYGRPATILANYTVITDCLIEYLRSINGYSRKEAEHALINMVSNAFKVMERENDEN